MAAFGAIEDRINRLADQWLPKPRIPFTHGQTSASPGGATAVHLAVQAFHFQPQAAIAGGVGRIAPLRNDPFEAGDR
jgi:hypothetical protein